MSCAANGCTARFSKKEKGVRFLGFPRNQEIRKSWAIALGRAGWIPSDHSLVCSKHFKTDDFDTSSPFQKRVKPGVVPSMFTEFHAVFQKSILKGRKEIAEESLSNDLEDGRAAKFNEPVTTKSPIDNSSKKGKSNENRMETEDEIQHPNTDPSSTETQSHRRRESRENTPRNDSLKLRIYLKIKSDPFTDTAIRILNDSRIMCLPPVSPNGCENEGKPGFEFSKVFGPETTQKELFDETVAPCIKHVIRSRRKEIIRGRHSHIFSYGTVKAGKMFTLRGDLDNPGLIPRTLHSVFSKISLDEEVKYVPVMATRIRILDINESVDQTIHAEKLITEQVDEYDEYRNMFLRFETKRSRKLCKSSVWVSLFELRNEDIYDLLKPPDENSQDPLELRLDEKNNYYIEGLTHVCAQSAAEAYAIYSYGMKNFSAGTSSQSHCVLIIKIITRCKGNIIAISSLSIYDLTTVEWPAEIPDTGLEDSPDIDLSIHSLNRCLRAIQGNQDTSIQHVVPCWLSKLTKLSCSAISNLNSKIVVLVNVNSSPELYGDTEKVMKLFALNGITVAEPPEEDPPDDADQDEFNIEFVDCQEVASEEEIQNIEETYESLKNRVNELNQEIKKKDEVIEQIRSSYQKVLEDTSKRHLEEMQKIKNELQSIKANYEYKASRKTNSLNKAKKPEIRLIRVNDTETRNSVEEMEFEDTKISIKNDIFDEKVEKNEIDLKKSAFKKGKEKENHSNDKIDSPTKETETVPSSVVEPKVPEIYQCAHCNLTFNRRVNFRRHIRFHFNVKSHKCDQCGSAFMLPSDLKKHSRTHTDVRAFKCDQCDKDFRTNANLSEHKRRTHLGLRPYACSECGQRFAHSSHWKRHLVIHTGEKPYECDRCGSRFAVKGDFTKHCTRHLNIKPFACEICPSKFLDRSGLRLHMLIHKKYSQVPKS